MRHALDVAYFLFNTSFLLAWFMVALDIKSKRYKPSRRFLLAEYITLAVGVVYLALATVSLFWHFLPVSLIVKTVIA